MSDVGYSYLDGTLRRESLKVEGHIIEVHHHSSPRQTGGGVSEL